MTENSIFFFSFFFLFLSGNAVGSENNGVDCNPHHAVFDDFGRGINYIIQCTYLFKNLNAECVSAACPQLTTACPRNCDGSLNPQALSSFGSILTSCVQSQKVICGVNLGQIIPYLPLTFTTNTLIDPKLANGTCSLNSGTGLVQFLNNSAFDFPVDKNSGSGPIYFRLNVPFFNYEGKFTCDFTLGGGPEGQCQRVTFPDMVGQANYTVSSMVSVDPSTYEVKVLSSDTQLHVGGWNFTVLGVSLPPCLVGAFNRAAYGFFVRSAGDSVAANFLSTLAVSGLRAAAKNCA